ncbi:serine/threonine protein kinase [Stratiformator vulcanicus]|uniref:non-specific serine/threonine protein kinase n=1 Tax=Stratiformator vulcanicus TaxID=2527980 RepID=A0A517R746_9PLAN|nr:serine/threonine-protein kinase [Stratiformator vulcanicus]QDT39651.1 Serine/threonine-protein kinase PrkC [Stratiformator vulcanicus]
MTPSQVGPYRIEEQLGSGGMGDVYLGVHEELGRRAAVKVLPASLAREPGFVSRFEREIDAMRRLNQPNIVRVFESGTEDGIYFLAMEYAEGETLLSILRREKKLPWRQVIAISIQVCSALKHAHDVGIIHRDIKPSNLMIADNGTVKLLDFGVAQVFAGTKLTATGGIIGTAEYMSPEQAEGKRATKQSDLYSLGALMYVMLTGRPPFSGNTMLDVIRQHRYGQFDRPRRYTEDIPIWLDDLVCSLLEKAPSKRPPNAFVLSRRLKEIIPKVELSTGQSEQPPVEDTTVDGPIDDPSSEFQGNDLPTQTAPGTTESAPMGSRGPGEATLVSSLMRAEIEAEANSPLRRFFDNTWVLISLLIIVILGGYAWIQYHHVTPEERFEIAERVLSEPPSNRWLVARSDHLRPLLEIDPEKWGPKVDPLLRQIAEWQAVTGAGQSRLDRTPPTLGVTDESTGNTQGPAPPAEADRDPSAGEPAPSDRLLSGEPQRILDEVEAKLEQGDILGATAQLGSLRDLLAGFEDDRFEAARQRLNELQTRIDGYSSGDKTTSFVDAAIDRAATAMADYELSGEQVERTRALKMYEALLFLYGDDDPEVRDLASAAIRRLEGERDGNEPAPSPLNRPSPPNPSDTKDLTAPEDQTAPEAS